MIGMFLGYTTYSASIASGISMLKEDLMSSVKNVSFELWVELWKILLTHIHMKLGFMKNFIKAFTKNEESFRFFFFSKVPSFRKNANILSNVINFI